MYFFIKLKVQHFLDVLLLSFVGFGERDLEPAAPIGFNLTFMCPEGEPFSFIMTVCKNITILTLVYFFLMGFLS